MIGEQCLDLIFRNARTHTAWLDKPVRDDTSREIYDAMKWRPTSANTNPARWTWSSSMPAANVKPAIRSSSPKAT